MAYKHSKHTLGYFNYTSDPIWNEKCSLVKDWLIMNGIKIFGEQDNFYSIAGAVLRASDTYYPINSREKALKVIDNYYLMIAGV